MFVDGDVSDGEENEDFYPDDCQWVQEEEPAIPEAIPVITEKVTALLLLDTAKKSCSFEGEVGHFCLCQNNCTTA